MSSISVSSLVLGSLTMEVEGADASLSLSVLATAPAVLSVELGTPGAQGDAATIAVGTTTTLAPGSSATVANAGTSSAAVFNFGIPAGQTGAAGATGSQGPAGTAATIAAGTTTTGAPGSSASVTNAGTSSAAVFNFTIPRGDKGETGNTGATGATGSPGTAATIAAGTTTTGAPGSSASVTNSGTSGAAVFDFTIPRGDVGATGATGATGPAGPGVAAGGTTGQLLTKASGTNYDTTWTTVIPGDRYLTTSTTSLTINNANKTLTIGTGLSYSPQQDITISESTSPTTRHMHARVTTYNSGTGVMVVDVISHTGTGTYSSWVVNVGGVTPVTSTAWGSITGTLSAQTDLQTALDAKLAKASNLSDLANASTARTNLGLGTAAVEPATKLVPAGGTTGQVLSKASATDWDLVWATAGGGGGGSGADVQVFTTAGTATWTKPAGKTMALVKVWAGGNGGGSGSRLATTVTRSGGAGGTSGGFIQMFVPLSTLASTVTVTVGSGGAGGASVTTDNTNGNQGSIGTASIFGTLTASPSSNLANGGTGAAVTAPAYSPNAFNLFGSFLPNLSQVGGGGNGTTTSGAAPANSTFDRYMFDLPTGGGGGGGNTANNTFSSGGGAGGGRFAAVSGASGFTTAVAGGAGATPLLAPTTGTSGVASYFGGTGGGGGGYRSAANGGSTAGAAGAQPGGGGGGGAASDNGTPSGAGGAGGRGMVVVISF